jgi:hypothetical protein
VGAHASRKRAIWVTGREREILAFAAEHRFVLSAQVQELLGVSSDTVSRSLRSLGRRGLLTRNRVCAHTVCRITRRGLDCIGSELPMPRWWLGNFEHDVGIAWVWIAAQRGAFGLVGELVSERTMRSHDGRPGAEPYGVKLGGVAGDGRVRVHYPDLLLLTRDGRRVALELELRSKERGRREGILSGFAGDGRLDRVLYLAERSTVGADIVDSARRLGISSLVRVQPVRFTSPIGLNPPPRAALPARARDSERAL